MTVLRVLLGFSVVWLAVGCSSPPPAMRELVCDDGRDDDGDGAIDCADSDCACVDAGRDAGRPIDGGRDAGRDAALERDAGRDAMTGTERSALECMNGIDDDGDDLVDCEDPDCRIDLSRCLDGGTPPDVPTPARITVTWSMPAVSTLAGGLDVEPAFPTHLAHLFGPTVIRSELPLRVLCASITNEGGSGWSGTLQTRFPGYAVAAMEPVAVGASSSLDVCVDPVLDLVALDALTDSASATVEGELRDGGGAIVDTYAHAVRVMTTSDVVWEHPTASPNTMRDMSTVFVERGEPALLGFLRAAEMRSAFSTGLLSGDDPLGYFRTDLPVDAGTLAPGAHASEVVHVETGEPISVFGTTGGTIDLLVFTEAAYEAFRVGGAAAPVASQLGVAVGGGAYFDMLAPGFYVLVARNPGAASIDLTYERAITREDVVRDALRAVFEEARARSLDFVPVDASFFRAGRRVHRVGEVLAAPATLHAFDGAMLFAAALMRIGMDPFVVFSADRVYVSVRSAPGSSVRWAIDPSAVGGATPFFSAYRAANTRYGSDRGAAGFREIDLAMVRAEGIAEIPR